jgi:SNF2 family DNA or RNA helicase
VPINFSPPFRLLPPAARATKPPASAVDVIIDGQPPCVTRLGLELRPYQLEGVNWLRHSWARKQVPHA